MSKRTILYIAIALLGLFAATALYQYAAEAPERYANTGFKHRIPFIHNDSIVFVSPAGIKAGLEVGDKIASINGVAIDSNETFRREIAKVGESGVADLIVVRPSEDNAERQIRLELEPMVFDANFYLRLAIGFIFAYIFPAFCIFFGLWVLLLRPADFLAWLLLFLLWGIASMALESFGDSPVLTAFRTVFNASWALSMFLFAVYFPERWSLDRRVPWLKYIIVIPLTYQIFITLIGLLEGLAGVEISSFLEPINAVYAAIAGPMNLLAISLFFVILGWKSGTLESPDARRRLRVMVVGSMVALFPTFIIIIYALVSGARGSFFDIFPTWFALFALFTLLLFPLTMAYVIVVQRAMDVSIVVRQGLQYALASGGIRVIQMLLLVAIGLLVAWSINNFGFSLGSQLAFIVAGVALVPLVEWGARPLKTWIDRRFFREAYDAERILSDLSEDVRTMVETRPLVETVANTISETLHVPQVSILLDRNGRFVPSYSIGFDTPPPVSIDRDSRAVKRLGSGRNITLYDDVIENTSAPAVSLDEREQLRELNTQVLLPVTAKDRLAGMISLSPKRSEEPYTPSDLRLLRSVATQTGLALENSRLTEAFAREAAQRERLNAEVEIAREVQERLFPQDLPRIEGVEYFGACRPALAVGGDYYDFLELPDGKFGFAIGDVSGKGIGASLMMASLQASLRGQAIHAGKSLAEMMSSINQLLYDASTTNRYATFFYAEFDPATRRLAYVNAGHNPPFLLRGEGGYQDTLTLEAGGPVVGMLPSMLARYEQGEIELRPGDLIVGFTDGISEAMDPDENEWGEDALLEKLRELFTEAPRAILEKCVAAADAFANGAKQHDDMTMIIIRCQTDDR